MWVGCPDVSELLRLPLSRVLFSPSFRRYLNNIRKLEESFSNVPKKIKKQNKKT
jgi:hypothetical protein